MTEMKSLAKLKNVFSSPREGLTKFSKFELKVLAELEVINSNVLYLTYRIDKISAQQKTLDSQEYYEDYGTSDNNPDSEAVPVDNPSGSSSTKVTE